MTQKCKPRLAVIWWKDATIYVGTTNFDKDDDEISLLDGLSVGWVTKDTGELIALAGDYWKDNDNFRTVSVYPKSQIQDIRYIEFERNGDAESN